MMSEQEYLDTKIKIETTNPHRRCVCANWNNDDGTCSYCEWEEEHNEEETKEEIPNEHFIRALIGDQAFDIIRNSKGENE
jgi:hypothetical protein